MKKLCLFIIALPVIFCGCEDQYIPESGQHRDTVLSVMEVGFGIKSANSPVKSYFEQGDELGLHIYRNQSLSQYKLTYLNPQWYLNPIVTLAEGNSQVYAFYPYDPENNDPVSLSIEHTSGTDYLYSSTHTVSPSSSQLHLEMKHALALIEFVFEYMPQMETGAIDFISIEGYALHSMAALNIQSGSLTPIDGMHEPAIIYGWQMEDPVIHSGMKVGLKVVPVTEVKYTGDITFNFYFEGFKSNWPVPVGTSWESGKKYTYKVLINERELHIVYVQIEDWTEAGYESIYLPYQ